MTEQAAEGGRIPVPADDPGVLAAMVVGSAVNDIRTAIAERVGLTGSEPLTVILAKLDEALQRKEEPPEGTVLVDREALDVLEHDAAAGRVSRHENLVAGAVRVGRIPPSARSSWLTLLETTPGAENTLKSIRPNTVRVSAAGYSTEHDRDEAHNLIREVFGP